MRKASIILIVLGLVLHAEIAFVEAEGGISGFGFGLLVWSWLPYLICLYIVLGGVNPIVPMIGIVGPLIMDTLNYYSVFISPDSSTAALGLVWMPLWNLVLFMPVGLLLGYGIGRYMWGRTSNKSAQPKR